ncbi:MAG: ABC transporter permease [Bacteroidaceae bacterium]|nr:ABC transporter permease [Bacteroidaceae bacterium]
MNLELFIAKRLYGTRKGARRISRPAVAVAQWGVAVGTVVMFVSICIIVGFKHTIRDKVVGFGGHIQLMDVETAANGDVPMVASDELLAELSSVEGVKNVAPTVQKPGMVLAGGEYEGVVLKGVGDGYDLDFLKENLVEGTLPSFTGSAASGSVVISRYLASRLKVAVGDKLNLYFLQNGVKARRMSVAAIYETHLSELDGMMAVTDMYTVRRLNGWGNDEVNAVEISINDYEELENVRQRVNGVAMQYSSTSRLYAPTIEELYPALFAWLGVLDQTVWLILVLVLFIAGFTMVSGLLILILEKSSFIGTMKALGAGNVSVARVFLYYACIVIGKGIVAGNAVALLLCLLQKYTGVVALDPEMYYMTSVPVEFSWLLIPMNVFMFLLSVAMLLLPSMFIARIEPTKAIRFE